VTPRAESVTVRRAAAELDCGEHHIRRLIRAKRLQASGTGKARRVLAESLEKYRSESKKDGPFADMSVAMSVDQAQNRVVFRLMKSVPALSKPDSAARLLGIPRGEFNGLVRSGAVPTVTLGTERFIPAKFLCEMLGRAYGIEGVK
jgi:excisionase family DNA binding protein